MNNVELLFGAGTLTREEAQGKYNTVSTGGGGMGGVCRALQEHGDPPGSKEEERQCRGREPFWRRCEGRGCNLEHVSRGRKRRERNRHSGIYSLFAWNDEDRKCVGATLTERINDKSSDYIFYVILTIPNQENRTKTKNKIGLK